MTAQALTTPCVVTGRADAEVSDFFKITVKAGQRVIAIDVRGFGETAPAEPPKTPSHFGGDFKETYLALHLNRPLLGQRVFVTCYSGYGMDVKEPGEMKDLRRHLGGRPARLAPRPSRKTVRVPCPTCPNRLTAMVRRPWSASIAPAVRASPAPGCSCPAA